jgi:hypothetical protein
LAGASSKQVIDQTYWLVHFRAGSLTADPLGGATGQMRSNSVVPFLLALALGLAAAEGAAQNSPGTAIPDALRSLTSGFGGCGEAPTLHDTTFQYFPLVRFIRGYCTLEHGDPASAIVAIDSDSVLYLLGSVDAFRFLVQRHPPPAVDSADLMAYVQVALELSGRTSAYDTLVRDFSQLPDSLRVVMVERGRKPLLIFVAADGRWLDARFYTLNRAHFGPVVHRRQVVILSNGYLVSAQDSLIYTPPGVR